MAEEGEKLVTCSMAGNQLARYCCVIADTNAHCIWLGSWGGEAYGGSAEGTQTVALRKAPFIDTNRYRRARPWLQPAHRFLHRFERGVDWQLQREGDGSGATALIIDRRWVSQARDRTVNDAELQRLKQVTFRTSASTDVGMQDEAGRRWAYLSGPWACM